MQTSPTSIWRVILQIVFRDPLNWLNVLFDILHRLPIFKTLPGMYEVLSHDVVLELKDSRGKKAIYHKRQKVRFLQDNIIAFYDRAWGDGNIFDDYKCSPGVEVDRFRDGYQYNILISLRETKHRGDKTTFNIQRTITDGFTKDEELLQSDVNHRMHTLSLSVIFPKSRLPTEVNMVEQNSDRTQRLDSRHLTILPDGRQQYKWETNTPRLFESYIMRWKW
jgi:hypothetical protein